MNTARRIALAVALLSAAGLGLSVYTMARRVAEHNQRERKVYFFKEILKKDFEFKGVPVHITDINPGTPDWHLNIAYGAENLRLHVSVPGNPKLPDLVAHNDWLRVLLFAEARHMTAATLEQKVREGEVPERLAIVTRSPLPGAEPGKWQDVWKSGWAYDFYEFDDGHFKHERFTYPTGKPDREPKPGQLPADTWQFQAASAVTPQTQRPSNRFTMDALNAAGWTLPAAAWSTMLLLGSIAIVVAPARRRSTSPSQRP
ncbi:MAG: hypothetical protein KF805_12830 [Phycisphaeraceae bacterium]|nr:hypothetical protein [Phycisphaeraceae bacterium]